MRLLPLFTREYLEQAWPHILPWAEQMAARYPDEWPVAEQLRRAASGELLIWLIVSPERTLEGIVGTIVHLQASGRKILEVALASGREHREWVSQISRLEEHARHFGCDEVVIRGRAGWLASLEGYQMRKEITLVKTIERADARAA